MRTACRRRPEPGDPGRPRMRLEPLDQLGRGVLAHARLRSREQRPLIDALAQASPVEHVAVRGRLGGPPLPVHLVPVLPLRILSPPPRPFPPRRCPPGPPHPARPPHTHPMPRSISTQYDAISRI